MALVTKIFIGCGVAISVACPATILCTSSPQEFIQVAPDGHVCDTKGGDIVRKNGQYFFIPSGRPTLLPMKKEFTNSFMNHGKCIEKPALKI